jgi:hypothetical protein
MWAPVKNTYGFTIGASGLPLTGISNPLTISLQVGANIGATNVKAVIF